MRLLKINKVNSCRSMRGVVHVETVRLRAQTKEVLRNVEVVLQRVPSVNDFRGVHLPRHRRSHSLSYVEGCSILTELLINKNKVN